MDMKNHKKVFRAQGWIAPVVLVDGRVLAVWNHQQARNRLQVTVTKLGPISQRITTAIKKEARDLGRFLGTTNVDIQVS